jgi:hypothetical protein
MILAEYCDQIHDGLVKSFFVVRQDHHERNKVNDFSISTVRPELVAGCFYDFFLRFRQYIGFK